MNQEEIILSMQNIHFNPSYALENKDLKNYW